MQPLRTILYQVKQPFTGMYQRQLRPIEGPVRKIVL